MQPIIMYNVAKMCPHIFYFVKPLNGSVYSLKLISSLTGIVEANRRAFLTDTNIIY